MKKNKKNIKKRIEQKRSRHVLKRKKQHQTIHKQKQKDTVEEIKTGTLGKYIISYEEFAQKFVMTIEVAKRFECPVNMNELYKRYIYTISMADYCYVNLRNIEEVDAFNAEVYLKSHEFMRNAYPDGVKDKKKRSNEFDQFMQQLAKDIQKRNLKAMFDKLSEEARHDAQK